MFNRGKRQHVKATVVAGDLSSLQSSNMASWDFVLDVRPEIGPVFRAATTADFLVGGKIPQPGDLVDVSFDINGGDDVRLELAGDGRFN